MIQQPPISTLFPYTTLFRSTSATACSSSVWLTNRLHSVDVDDPRHGHDLVAARSEEHTSELQSHHDLVCRLLLEKKNKTAELLAFSLRIYAENTNILTNTEV